MKAIVGVAVALGFAGSGACPAQSVAGSSAAASCQRNAEGAASYSRCSLWLEDDRLILGSPGEQVSHAEALRPVALSRFVTGDSARHYALRYERDARRGLWLRLAAGAMMLTASVKAVQTRCVRRSWSDDNISGAGDRLFLSGMAVELASAAFRFRAEREGTRAIGWHNGALSR
jgi:hypothetical protein